MADEKKIGDEIVEAVARAMVAHDLDDWDDPALTPDTPRSRAEEFRESYRQAARELLAVAYPLLRKQWKAEYPRHDRESRFVHRVSSRVTRTLIWPEDGDGSEWRTEVRDSLVGDWRPAGGR